MYVNYLSIDKPQGFSGKKFFLPKITGFSLYRLQIQQIRAAIILGQAGLDANNPMWTVMCN